MKGWMFRMLLLCFSADVCAATFSSNIEAVSSLTMPVEAVAPVAMVDGQGLLHYQDLPNRLTGCSGIVTYKAGKAFAGQRNGSYAAGNLYSLTQRKGLSAATGSFGSTSAYICSGMVAEAAVPVTTVDMVSASQRRKAPTGGGSSTGEWINPIGDAWWFLVLLAAGYAVVRGKQRRRKEV